MFLKVNNVGAERTSSGRLFQVTEPATQNAQLPSCSFVLGTNKYVLLCSSQFFCQQSTFRPLPVNF